MKIATDSEILMFPFQPNKGQYCVTGLLSINPAKTTKAYCLKSKRTTDLEMFNVESGEGKLRLNFLSPRSEVTIYSAPTLLHMPEMYRWYLLSEKNFKRKFKSRKSNLESS